VVLGVCSGEGGGVRGIGRGRGRRVVRDWWGTGGELGYKRKEEVVVRFICFE
jgi:hypothetical protein